MITSISSEAVCNYKNNVETTENWDGENRIYIFAFCSLTYRPTDKIFIEYMFLNKEIRLLWSNESFEVKYNIGFGIPIEFQS